MEPPAQGGEYVPGTREQDMLSAPSVFEAEEDPFSGGIRKIGGLHRPQHLKLIQVNAGGAKGAWRVLDEMAEGAFQDAHVVAVQEHGMDDSALAAYKKVAEGRGWVVTSARAYTTAGRWQKDRMKGGALTLVRVNLNQGDSWVREDDTAVLVHTVVDEWMFVNAYSPPRDEALAKLAQLMAQTSTEATMQKHCKWLVVGDVNQDEKASEQQKSVFFQTLKKVGGSQVPLGESSRWASSRTVDWRVTNAPAEISTPEVEECYLSDHKPISMEISISKQAREKVGELISKPKLERPVEYSKPEWRKLLARKAEEVEDLILEQLERLKDECTVDIDEELQSWCGLVQRVITEVFEELIVQERVSENQAAKMMGELKKKVKLGEPTKWRQRDEKLDCPRSNSIQQARRRKWIARAYQLKADLKKLQSGADFKRGREKMVKRLAAGVHLIEGNSMKKKARTAAITREAMPDEKDQLIQWLQVRLELMKEAMHNYEEQERKDRYRGWRNRMRDLKEVGKWLKRKQDGPRSAIYEQGPGDQKIRAQTRSQATSMIKRRWGKLWDEQKAAAAATDVPKIIEELKKAVPKAEGFEWQSITWQEFLDSARRASGAQGTDGVQGDMMSCLPEKLLFVLFKQTKCWEAQRRAPTTMLDARQANLEKPGKAREGMLNVDHTRPITVMSAIWRTYSSAIAACRSLKDWLEATGVVMAEASDEAAAQVFQWMVDSHPYGAAQDYSSAYDVMRVDISAALLQGMGMPSNIVDVLAQVWQGQKRYVLWNNHCDKEPMGTGGAATPQGEPLGPLVMLLWVTVGSTMVQKMAEEKMDAEGRKRRTPDGDDQLSERPRQKRRVAAAEGRSTLGKRPRADDHEDRRGNKRRRPEAPDGVEAECTQEMATAGRQRWRKEKTYMDDRTSATTAARSVMIGVLTWEAWSASVLLRENPTKLQLTARREYQLVRLRHEAKKHGVEKAVKPHIEALGAVSVPAAGRPLVQKEIDRLNSAFDRAVTLKVIPGSRNDKLVRHRIFVVSKAAYGWVAADPGKDWCNKLNEAVMKVGLPRRANRQLRYLLDGSMVALEVVLATRRISIVASRFAKGSEWPWVGYPSRAEKGTLQSLIEPYLQETGWKKKGPWRWEHHELFDKHGWLELDLKEVVEPPEEDIDVKQHQKNRWNTMKRNLSHKIRAGWRWKQWQDAKEGNSHANEVIKDVQYTEGFYMFASGWRLHPIAKTLLVAGFHSPGDVKAQRNQPNCQVPATWKDTCPWCDEVGTHEHIFWQCLRDPEAPNRPPRPICELQARLGWAAPGTKEEKQYCDSVLSWQCRCVEEVWHQRYGKTPMRDKDRELRNRAQQKRRLEVEQQQSEGDSSGSESDCFRGGKAQSYDDNNDYDDYDNGNAAEQSGPAAQEPSGGAAQEPNGGAAQRSGAAQWRRSPVAERSRSAAQEPSGGAAQELSGVGAQRRSSPAAEQPSGGEEQEPRGGAAKRRRSPEAEQPGGGAEQPSSAGAKQRGGTACSPAAEKPRGGRKRPRGRERKRQRRSGKTTEQLNDTKRRRRRKTLQKSLATRQDSQIAEQANNRKTASSRANQLSKAQRESLEQRRKSLTPEKRSPYLKMK